MIDQKSKAFEFVGRWDRSTSSHYILYDLNNLIVGMIAENLKDVGFDYWVYSPKNKLNDYASGREHTIEAAKFLTEMLAKRAGWHL